MHNGSGPAPVPRRAGRRAHGRGPARYSVSASALAGGAQLQARTSAPRSTSPAASPPPAAAGPRAVGSGRRTRPRLPSLPHRASRCARSTPSRRRRRPSAARTAGSASGSSRSGPRAGARSAAAAQFVRDRAGQVDHQAAGLLVRQRPQRLWNGTATGRASARQRARASSEVKAGRARRPSGAWRVGTAMSLVFSRRSPSGPVSVSPAPRRPGPGAGRRAARRAPGPRLPGRPPRRSARRRAGGRRCRRRRRRRTRGCSSKPRVEGIGAARRGVRAVFPTRRARYVRVPAGRAARRSPAAQGPGSTGAGRGSGTGSGPRAVPTARRRPRRAVPRPPRSRREAEPVPAGPAGAGVRAPKYCRA